MPDLEEALAAARADCAARPLLPAAGLRQLGDRRTRRRRVTAAGGVTGVAAIVVAAAVTIPGQDFRRPPNVPPDVPPNGSGVTGPLHTTMPSGWPPSRPGAGPTGTVMPSGWPPSRSGAGPTGTTAPTGPDAPPPCRADQLGKPVLTDAASPLGPGFVAAFTNHGATCRIDGVPVLWHTEPGSSPALVPLRTAASKQFVIVAAGRQGAVVIVSSDTGGTAGSAPTNPECPGRAPYHDLALGLADGSVPMPGATIDVLCGGVYAQWQ